ncbi:Hypothetical protein, putative [Bodo saltans]|uniref:Uncharacterized protein n=1 Tax=Bodo saltans TaxID=75058 RepID=A0A0S4IZL5_BODSA|nr:Hypothetical protein, putative [Bodo saltans]|eukprot:CUG05846.1 Hypothetical protein, putative [Bodo saltans]
MDRTRRTDVEPPRSVKHPTVPRKIRAASASTSACNLRLSTTIPEAFRTNPDTAILFSKGAHDVEALRKARLELGVSHVARDGRRDTRIVFGKTTVGLNGEETGKLADDIVNRVWREDVSRQKVEDVNKASAQYRRRLMRSNSAARLGASVITGSKLDGSTSFSVREGGTSLLNQSGSWRSSSARPRRVRADSILLFPSIVRACERWLARARVRVAANSAMRQEQTAVATYDTSLKKLVLNRWLSLHHAFLLGRRTALHRILKKWKLYTHQRSQTRRGFYRTLMQSIDRYRLHRLLCLWYTYHIAEKALQHNHHSLDSSTVLGNSGSHSHNATAHSTLSPKDMDPMTMIVRRPAGKSIFQRRPEIVFQAIDAAHANQARTQRMTTAIEHQQTKALRMPWDAWRAYIFTRRIKSNRYQMLRIHRTGRVAGRVLTQCFSKWRFRMNASRSLSLYLYRLQSKALLQWRNRAQLLSDDQARVDQLRESKFALMKRSCLMHWKRRSKESTVFDLVGNCRVLENGARLMPFAFVFATLLAESNRTYSTTSNNGSSSSSGVVATWAEGRANAALSCKCFQQWRKVWLRRKSFEKIIKQQHRVYCGLLLRRAFAAWRSPESSWDDIVFIHQVVNLSQSTEGAAGPGNTSPHFALGGSMSQQPSKETTAAGAATAVAPVVRLFGPRVDDAVLPWLTLRSVERHCRRSYSALGNLHAVSTFAPRRLFEVDSNFYCHREMSGGGGVSDLTKSIADKLFDEAEFPNLRSLSQCSSVTTLQLELESSLMLNVTKRVRSSSIGSALMPPGSGFGAFVTLPTTGYSTGTFTGAALIPTWHLANSQSVAAINLNASRTTTVMSVASSNPNNNTDDNNDLPDGPVLLSNGAFYRHFLFRRILQSLFVVGRVVIASKHASTRLNEFRDLMFSKHVVLSRERITDLQDALHGFAVNTGIANTVSRSQRLRDGGGSSPKSASLMLESMTVQYLPTDRIANRAGYLDGCIARRSTEFLHNELITEQEAFVVEFSTQLQSYKDSLQQRYKQKLLMEAPQEILATIARLGFPHLDLTEVELNLGAIASFLNAQIAANVALRVAFRMRRAFVLKRWAVVDAAVSYWTTAGVARYEPPKHSAPPLPPQPPKPSKKRRSSARRRVTTAVVRKPAISLKHRALRAEQLALAIAIQMRVHLALRHLPEHYTPSTVVCLVPPKTLVHTVARSQNAPDKLLR